MRIWVGVHPGELDDTRLLAQQVDARNLLGLIDAEYKNPEKSSILIEFWSGDRQIGALCYFQALVVDVIEQRHLCPHIPAVFLSPIILAAAGRERPKLRYLKTKDGTAPLHWPPHWVPTADRIADIMDLQAKWGYEKEYALRRALTEKYGEWPGGSLFGQTTPEKVSTQMIEKYLAFRKERAGRLESFRI